MFSAIPFLAQNLPTSNHAKSRSKTLNYVPILDIAARMMEISHGFVSNASKPSFLKGIQDVFLGPFNAAIRFLFTTTRIANIYNTHSGGNMHLRSPRSFLFLLSCVQLLACNFVQAEELQVAVFGLGGRAQGVLTECLKLEEETGKTIRVVAICDDHAQESYDFFVKNSIPAELSTKYAQLFKSQRIYPDTEDGMRDLLENHPNVDRIFITSSNNRHAAHLQAVLKSSACRNIYLEKPLFKAIEEFSQFNHDLGDRNIQVGLTLRSARITQLAAEHLKTYKASLGKLQKVHSWEHVNFAHGLSIIMMNWRRYKSMSGGLLIEKSVHDLDLAYFFMEAVDVHPQSISVTTDVRHDFYKKSNQQNITDRLLTDASLRKSAEPWDQVPWQRVIPFSYNDEHAIDWSQTMAHFFAEFPDNDDFSHSDIIPDAHAVHNQITTTDGDVVEYDLDLKLNGFETQTERGCRLTFEHGTAELDMESSKLLIQVDNQPSLEIDLNTRGVPHAGGDVFVAHGILGTLPPGSSAAQFSDPSVQISSVIGLVSEHQALHHIDHPLEVRMNNGHWEIDLN